MANKQVRDTVFRDYFNDPKRLMSLCNALLGMNITDPNEIKINTLEGTFFSSVKNDISCQIGDEWLILTEHQTTVNYNMPLRFLNYIVELYKAYLAPGHKNIYGMRQISLPMPRFIVFYDGKVTENVPRELRLSDAFRATDDKARKEAPLELVVTQYALASDDSKELREKCPEIDEYGRFSTYLRACKARGLSNEETLRETIAYCISHDIMKEYLERKGMEVLDMWMNEYDENAAREVIREEALEEGMERGIAKGRAEGRAEGEAKGTMNGIIMSVKNLMKSLNFSATQAIETLQVPHELRKTVIAAL